MAKECEAGCSRYEGGEVKHIKECVFYPESLSAIHDQVVNALKLAYGWMDLPGMAGWTAEQQENARQQYRAAKAEVCDVLERGTR